MKRKANLELLRCVAMMMVVVLHYLGKGNILSDLTGAEIGSTETVAWFLESFCIVAVNVYMLISGYFLSTSIFKVSRLVKLYLQLWFYSVGVGVSVVLLGVVPLGEVTVHDLLTLVFPVFMDHYWFVSAYLFLYLFLPFISGAVQRMNKRQMQLLLGMLLLAFCVLKSVLPVRLELDAQGYDCIWYLCVFFTAAYIRKFGSKVVEKLRNSLLLYAGGCLLIFAVTMGLHLVYVHTGSLGRIITGPLEYNHILPYLAAIGLFGVFLQVRVPEKLGIVINKIAPHTLGVYLLHENIFMRYQWQQFLGVNRVDGVLSLILWTLLAVCVVFAAGILVDMLRAGLMKLLHGLLGKISLYRRVVAWIEDADKVFAE